MKTEANVLHFYRQDSQTTETCFNVGISSPLSREKESYLRSLLVYSHEPGRLNTRSFLGNAKIWEVGPRLTFPSVGSSNALAILHSVGLTEITRLEESRRSSHGPIPFDRMTECEYPEPLTTFAVRAEIEPVYTLPLLKEGMSALKKFDSQFGLALDDYSAPFCLNYFVEEEQRNPTNIEVFPTAASLCEHSRHGFWGSLHEIDGVKMPETLLHIAQSALQKHKGRDLVGFGDNAGVIRGYHVPHLVPMHPGRWSSYGKITSDLCITCKLESHNHPSATEPFQGSATGVGGLVRDLLCPGQGGEVLFLSVGYFGGQLLLKKFRIAGERRSWKYPSRFVTPLQFLTGAIKGSTGYANPLGKPVIYGYTRAGGILTPWGERRENIKPTLAAGGVGIMQRRHAVKEESRRGMCIVRIGGPAYWVGLGGGTASSMGAGENSAELDFASVQRGDPEMKRRVFEVFRECLAHPSKVFLTAHNQGGSGLDNMLRELLGRAGGKVDVGKVTLGDPTLPVLAIQSAEWQESVGVLVWKRTLPFLRRVCRRCNVPLDVLGGITGDGRYVVPDSRDNTTPVDINLRRLLHNLPQKVHRSKTPNRPVRPPKIDWDTPVLRFIKDVFGQVAVGSKGNIVNIGDRSVGGLVTGQQCCGPHQQPVADVAETTLSSRTNRGAASAIGEQPLKLLLNPQAGARMSVGESLLNICAAPIGSLENVTYAVNWMSSAKRAGEAPFIYRAASAGRDLMIELRNAQNGGKDSSSKFVTWAGTEVKGFTEMIVTAFAPMRDARLTLTPDVKRPGTSMLGYIDLGRGKYRLGGSNLLFSRGQLSNECPDIDDVPLFVRTWNVLQKLISEQLLLSYHDISDGGLIACLSEMLIAGSCGANLTLQGVFGPKRFISQLFAEELGVLFEYELGAATEIQILLSQHNVPATLLGSTTREKSLSVEVGGKSRLAVPISTLFHYWQRTSARLEEEQMNPALAKEEARWNRRMVSPQIKLTFTPRETPPSIRTRRKRHKVAVLWEQGSNGHPEMISIVERAGMEAVGVAMTDLGTELKTLKGFRGTVFVGGFSFQDKFGAGRGWHARIEHNPRIRDILMDFDRREDTWGLGVCNGCQMEALRGSAPFSELPSERRPILVQNKSGKFESRWLNVGILDSPAIMFRKMAGTVFGIWGAHGEGRFEFTDPCILEQVLRESLIPMVYVDSMGQPTEQYPCNPNGSPHGIAALCSSDGRRVIMMPHPERSERIVHCAYVPYALKRTLKASPWLQPFQNLREWCDE
jgi:phosphoribosylformylglycinamidine synthase